MAAEESGQRQYRCVELHLPGGFVRTIYIVHFVEIHFGPKGSPLVFLTKLASLRETSTSLDRTNVASSAAVRCAGPEHVQGGDVVG